MCNWASLIGWYQYVKDPKGLTGDQWLILNAFDALLMESKGVLQETSSLDWKPLSQFPLIKTIRFQS